MAKARTITQLIAALPDAARTTPVAGGKSLNQLLARGESACLRALDKVAKGVGGKDAWKWTMAKKVHHVLRHAGVDAEETGITPGRHTVRSTSPATKATRAAKARAELEADMSQGLLNSLFKDGDEGDGKAGVSDEEDSDEADHSNGADDNAGEDDDGPASEPEASADSEESSNEAREELEDEGAAPASDDDGADEEDEYVEARPLKRGRHVDGVSASAKARATKARGAAAASKRQSAAAWLDSIKALTKQVTSLSKHVELQGAALKASAGAVERVEAKLAVVQKMSADAAEQVKAVPQKSMEAFAEEMARGKRSHDEEVRKNAEVAAVAAAAAKAKAAEVAATAAAKTAELARLAAAAKAAKSAEAAKAAEPAAAEAARLKEAEEAKAKAAAESGSPAAGATGAASATAPASKVVDTSAAEDNSQVRRGVLKDCLWGGAWGGGRAVIQL